MRFPSTCSLLLLAALAPPAPAQAPFPGDLPGAVIADQMPFPFEGSGAVWHPRLQQLFAVSDNGRVLRLEADGTLQQVWVIGGDLEGVTVADPSTDILYVGNENPDSILEFNFVTGQVARTFDLTAVMTGPANSGLEALTFVPDAAHPEGGLFHAGLQDDGKVYVFDLPTATSATSTAVTHVTTYAPVAGRTDLAGLHYDPTRDQIYAIWDGANRVARLDRNGAFINEWFLPGTSQEGIATRGCELFIPEDTTDRILRYTSFPDLAACDNLSADRAELSIAAGGTVAFTLRAVDGIPPLSIYVLLGSTSGTSPGIAVGYKQINVPLNPDPYFDATLILLNQPPFVGTYGTFDASGAATAQLVVPTGLAPSLVGTQLHHAFLAVNPVSKGIKAASIPVKLTLVN